jgi:hypothetical protein
MPFELSPNNDCALCAHAANGPRNDDYLHYQLPCGHGASGNQPMHLYCVANHVNVAYKAANGGPQTSANITLDCPHCGAANINQQERAAIFAAVDVLSTQGETILSDPERDELADLAINIIGLSTGQPEESARFAAPVLAQIQELNQAHQNNPPNDDDEKKQDDNQNNRNEPDGPDENPEPPDNENPIEHEGPA